MSIPSQNDSVQLAQNSEHRPLLSLLMTLVLGALAGGMSWGIRGQYGHEVGAMMFGVLVGFVLVMRHMRDASSLQVARTVALFTIAIGFGGSMTYGQTVGLTHDREVHGSAEEPHWNGDAYRWGMVGLATKGGLWIGFGGAFLGMGMSGKTYRSREMLGIGVGMLFLLFLGKWILNSPFDPENQRLPVFYFSDHWRWEPEQYVKPRPEVWGGLLFAMMGLLVYLQFVKHDRLARNLAFWGIIGGLGFPLGQWLQAASIWNPQQYAATSFWKVGINNWNMMEVTFGTFAGLALSFGVWLNKRSIRSQTTDLVSLSWTSEGWWFYIYVYLLCAGIYFEDTIFEEFYAYGHLMGIIPMFCIVGGRYWPYLFVFPVIALPLAFKTYRMLCLQIDMIPEPLGMIGIVTLPLAFLIWVAMNFAEASERGARCQPFASCGLLLTSATFFWLNFAFLSFPWGWWTDWKSMAFQANSGGIYIVGWVVLSTAAYAAVARAPKHQVTAD